MKSYLFSSYPEEFSWGKQLKLLSKKLRSYTLFNTAVLASATAANGQVIYADIDPDYITSSCYELDFNYEGIFQTQTKARC